MDYDKRGIRMEYLISAIIDLVINIGTDFFKGIKGKIRLYKLKKRLKCEITAKILNRYGNEVYYNDLDQFLTKNKVIYNLIQNCLSASVFDYQSKMESINYYEQLFVEEHPTYSTYHSEMKKIIQSYFEVIFNALNPIGATPLLDDTGKVGEPAEPTIQFTSASSVTLSGQALAAGAAFREQQSPWY